jgi:hypothetical protein
MRIFRRAIGVAALCAAALAQAAPADDIRGLLEQGRSAEAYALGQKHPEELGKPDFDFYYGIAATDSGHAGEGVLAFERYVVQFPDNVRARLELARAYFVLGEMVRAREEFENVSRRKPPADVQATIDRFMDSIRAQESRYTPTANLWLEAGGGYDSNVNSGVGNGLVAVPALGNLQLQLAQAGVKSGSGFGWLAGGAQGSLPVAPGVALLGGVQFDGKFNSDSFDRQFDQGNLGAWGGVSVIKDRDLWRATASYSTLSVDYNRFRNVGALGGEWHRQVDELNTASVFAQYARMEYPSSPVRDSDFYALGAGWRRAFTHRLQPVVQVQGLVGREKNDASPGPVRDDLSRDLYTLRAGVSLTPAPAWGVSAGLNYTRSDFRANDPLFLQTRKDDYYGVDATVSYRWSRQLSIRGEYTWSDNRSNLALYKYDRSVIAVKVRYDFQ